MRVLIGTVGYHNLRDYSLGPVLLPKLRKLSWPPSITIEEMNWGPIAIVQDLQSLTEPYDRIVFISARACGRKPGTLTMRRWCGGLPNNDNIQSRISEAVTGVISIDNLLVIGEYFKVWPEEVVVLDVEPGPEEMGETLTPAVQAVVGRVLEAAQMAATVDFTEFEGLVEMRGEQL